MDIKIKVGEESEFHLDNKKITITFTHKDFANWFNNTPNNFDYDHEIAHVTPGKEVEFAAYVLRRLQDDAPHEADDFVWSEPFTYIYNELLEDYKPEFLTYYEEDVDDEL